MKSWMYYLWNFWPPFFGPGIVLDKVSSDLKYVRMRLKKRPWTRNIVGTQFGGSIYSMTDPIYMTMLLSNLGRGYIVWDKAANVRFRKPGRTDLYAEFRLSDEDISDIKRRLETEPKIDWEKDVVVVDTNQQVIAEIKKIVHISKKKPN
jgi:hypothetical protein